MWSYALDKIMELSPIEKAIIIERAHERCIKAAKRILKFFKCKRCGRCCKVSPPTLEPEEIEAICHRLKIDPPRFIAEFCEFVGGCIRLKAPCPFLEEHSIPRCTIYDLRPEPCRLYPFYISAPAILAVDK